jgi:hypothetical protein
MNSSPLCTGIINALLDTVFLSVALICVCAAWQLLDALWAALTNTTGWRLRDFVLTELQMLAASCTELRLAQAKLSATPEYKHIS